MMSMQSHILKSIEKAIATAKLIPVQYAELANRGKVYAFDDAHQAILIIGYDFQDQYVSIEIRDRHNDIFVNFPCLQYHEGDRGLLAKIDELLAAEKAEAAYRLPQQIENELRPDRAEYEDESEKFFYCADCGITLTTANAGVVTEECCHLDPCSDGKYCCNDHEEEHRVLVAAKRAAELENPSGEYIEDESELTPCIVCGEPKRNGVRCGCV